MHTQCTRTLAETTTATACTSNCLWASKSFVVWRHLSFFHSSMALLNSRNECNRKVNKDIYRWIRHSTHGKSSSEHRATLPFSSIDWIRNVCELYLHKSKIKEECIERPVDLPTRPQPNALHGRMARTSTSIVCIFAGISKLELEGDLFFIFIRRRWLAFLTQP